MPHLKLNDRVERPSWEVLARSILNPYIPQNKTIMLSRLQKALEERKKKEAEAALRRKKKRLAGLNQSSSSESDDKEHRNPSSLNPSNINKSSKIWGTGDGQAHKQNPKANNKNVSNARKKAKKKIKAG